VMPAPLYVTSFYPTERSGQAYQSKNGVLFRLTANRNNYDYTLSYLSPEYEEREAAAMLTERFRDDEWKEFLGDLYNVLLDTSYQSAATQALYTLSQAQSYAESVNSQTPNNVKQLAKQLTAECGTDAQKVEALYRYLTEGEFKYSLEYVRPDDYNVETFLFRDKTGICYDFAGAFVELCRAAGVPARNVQGYSMSEHFRLSWDDENGYVITTEHGHAWAEVYLAGYGWATVDATAASNEMQGNTTDKSNVTITLQYSGLTLLVVLTAGLFVVLVIVPAVREKLFRRRYQRLRNAEAVQAAMQRLLKQWDADPADTARDVCERQAKFLGVDLSDLLAGFEGAVYGGFCDEATADRVFRNYCAAYDAYRAAVKRERAAKRAERKQAKAMQNS